MCDGGLHAQRREAWRALSRSLPATVAALVTLSYLGYGIAAAGSGVAASTVLDDVRMPSTDAAGNSIDQISGLAWDADEALLYAVSDYGHLITFKIDLADNKITRLDPVAFSSIEYSNGGSRFTDSEGIVVLNGANGIKGDSQVAVAFEDGPAAGIFDTQGNFLEPIALPAALVDPMVFQGSNQGIEAIGFRAGSGFVFAPQARLVGESAGIHQIYSTENMVWQFEAIQPKHTFIKDLQVEPDGSIMILEGVKNGGREIRLRRVETKNCGGDSVCPVVDYMPSEPELMQDRFEGITSVGGNLYLVASDEDEGSRLLLIRIAH